MHPWLVFLKESGKRLSDIEFLSIKDFGGKLKKNEGGLVAAGDLATLTASSGKDMYLARAQCNLHIDGTNSQAIGDEVVLKINDVIVETFKSSLLADNIGGGTGVIVYEFKNIGHKVAATQIIKLEVITLDTQSEAEGFIECFEETTGESPAV